MVCIYLLELAINANVVETPQLRRILLPSCRTSRNFNFGFPSRGKYEALFLLVNTFVHQVSYLDGTRRSALPPFAVRWARSS